nr:OsmC family peroxiredoxin [Flavisolibacter sp.]
MKRTATAVWNGTGKEGKGHLSTKSTVLNQTQYSYHSRFESGTGTNPEELIAAAHAGCFTMKVSFLLGEGGFTPETLETICEIGLENGAITGSHLKINGKVAQIDQAKFEEIVNKAAQE